MSEEVGAWSTQPARRHYGYESRRTGVGHVVRPKSQQPGAVVTPEVVITTPVTTSRVVIASQINQRRPISVLRQPKKNTNAAPAAQNGGIAEGNGSTASQGITFRMIQLVLPVVVIQRVVYQRIRWTN